MGFVVGQPQGLGGHLIAWALGGGNRAIAVGLNLIVQMTAGDGLDLIAPGTLGRQGPLGLGSRSLFAGLDLGTVVAVVGGAHLVGQRRLGGKGFEGLVKHAGAIKLEGAWCRRRLTARRDGW